MDYHEHARHLQKEATLAHRKWVRSLTPDQRRNLKRLGVLEPAEDHPEVDGHNPHNVADVANSSRARIERDPADEIDSIAATLADKYGITTDQADELLQWHLEEVASTLTKHEGELLAIVVGGLISSKNVQVAAAGLAFAAKLSGLNGYHSQAEFGRRHNLSVAAISKSTKAWQRDLGLSTSVHQKSEAACQTYSQIGTTAHWRTQKVKAARYLKRIKSNTPDTPET